MTAAFWYLIATSTRNKLRSQLKRLRNPRYALALLLGVGYFWFLFFTRTSRQSRQAPPDAFFDTFVTLLPLGVLLLTLYLWLFVKDRTALAFTQAEVTMLFTAPVSRRTLIFYKLARSQAAVLSTSLIWVLLLNHGNRPVEHAISYWLMLSTISMHRLGVALVRTSQAEHGAVGWRRSVPVLAVAAVLLAAVAYGFFAARGALVNAYDASDLRQQLVHVATTPPVSWALVPFRALIGPTFARDTGAWASALPAAIALFLVHVLWVLRTDAAFEEAAVEASAHRARWLAARRARGSSVDAISTRTKRRSTPLAPTGAPGVAILWKNYLWLARTGQFRALLGLPALCAVLMVLLADRSRIAVIMLFAACVAVASMTLLFGPMTMRNDLRGDLARVAILKTFPLPGRDILLAEVASSALPTALMQYLLTVVAVLTLAHFPRETIGSDIRLGIILGAPLLVVGINLANFTIHNGLALLFPAWVKTGETGVSGIETMGQSMLTAIVTLFMLGVMLIVPAIGGAMGYFTMRGSSLFGIIAGGSIAGLVLMFESYLVMNMLGGQLDRLEPASVS